MSRQYHFFLRILLDNNMSVKIQAEGGININGKIFAAEARIPFYRYPDEDRGRIASVYASVKRNDKYTSKRNFVFSAATQPLEDDIKRSANENGVYYVAVSDIIENIDLFKPDDYRPLFKMPPFAGLWVIGVDAASCNVDLANEHSIVMTMKSCARSALLREFAYVIPMTIHRRAGYSQVSQMDLYSRTDDMARDTGSSHGLTSISTISAEQFELVTYDKNHHDEYLLSSLYEPYYIDCRVQNNVQSTIKESGLDDVTSFILRRGNNDSKTLYYSESESCTLNDLRCYLLSKDIVKVHDNVYFTLIDSRLHKVESGYHSFDNLFSDNIESLKSKSTLLPHEVKLQKKQIVKPTLYMHIHPLSELLRQPLEFEVGETIYSPIVGIQMQYYDIRKMNPGGTQERYVLMRKLTPKSTFSGMFPDAYPHLKACDEAKSQLVETKRRLQLAETKLQLSPEFEQLVANQPASAVVAQSVFDAHKENIASGKITNVGQFDGSLTDDEKTRLIGILQEHKQKQEELKRGVEASKRSGIIFALNAVPSEVFKYMYKKFKDTAYITPALEDEVYDKEGTSVDSQPTTFMLSNTPDNVKDAQDFIPSVSDGIKTTYAMFGPSGSGKTHQTNKSIVQLTSQGFKITNIDVHYGRMMYEQMNVSSLTIDRDVINYTLDTLKNEWREGAKNTTPPEVLSVLNALFNAGSCGTSQPADMFAEILKVMGRVRQTPLNVESSRGGVMWTLKNGSKIVRIYDGPGTEDENLIILSLFDVFMIPKQTSISTEDVEAIRSKNHATAKEIRPEDGNPVGMAYTFSQEMDDNVRVINLLSDVYVFLVKDKSGFARPLQLAMSKTNKRRQDSPLDLLVQDISSTKKTYLAFNDIKGESFVLNAEMYLANRFHNYVIRLLEESRYINAFICELARKQRLRTPIPGVMYDMGIRLLVPKDNIQNQRKEYLVHKTIGTEYAEYCISRAVSEQENIDTHLEHSVEGITRMLDVDNIEMRHRCHQKLGKAFEKETSAMFSPAIDDKEVLKTVLVCRMTSRSDQDAAINQKSIERLRKMLIGRTIR